jgi:hypothetical protein
MVKLETLRSQIAAGSRPGLRLCSLLLACLVSHPVWSETSAEGPAREGFPRVLCKAEQTGGFHDYPEQGEAYEPALFHPQQFSLEENLVFMLNLAESEGNVDVYLTMTTEVSQEDGSTTEEATELECREVRGAGGGYGLSCVNLPPSEMILINTGTLRFTRTAVGGWTFAGATESLSGDSIFVEYGQCERTAATSSVPPF